MDMKEYFTFYSGPIPVENVFELTEGFLSNLYVNSSEVESLNIFFNLLTNYISLKNAGKIRETAYLCYLMSYYVFTVITPPNSDIIGLEFIEEAIRLDPEEEEYKDWLRIVEKGN